MQLVSYDDHSAFTFRKCPQFGCIKKSTSDLKKISKHVSNVKMYDIDAVNLEIFKTENIEAIIHSATNYSDRGQNEESIEQMFYLELNLFETQKNMVCKHS